MSQYKIEASTAQHIGARSEQQDRLAIYSSQKVPGYMMAILADGLGGRSGGAIAAQQLMHTAGQLFESFTPSLETVDELLRAIARETHVILKLNGITVDVEPHTTMVALVITPAGEAIWGHIGDSRLYRFQGPNFVERTIDHTYAEQLIQSGRLTREEAASHSSSNILVNALGSAREAPMVAISRYSPCDIGDSFLLCSDGLWHYFTEDELGAVIAVKSPRQAAAMLMTKAESRSVGHHADNRSMIIIKLTPAITSKAAPARGITRAY